MWARSNDVKRHAQSPQTFGTLWERGKLSRVLEVGQIQKNRPSRDSPGINRNSVFPKKGGGTSKVRVLDILEGGGSITSWSKISRALKSPDKSGNREHLRPGVAL